MTKQIWSEIRCDYYDEEEQFWSLDAWINDDPNSEGTVIAKIFNDHIEYIDTRAITNTDAQELIKLVQLTKS